jgi:hypothetical protein
MRLLRTLALLELGAWIGAISTAAFVKRALPSRGDADSDEVTLVAILDGIDLKSRAQAFRGGSMLSMFGGIAVDLREARLAPDARLSVHTLFGGIAVRVGREGARRRRRRARARRRVARRADAEARRHGALRRGGDRGEGRGLAS